MMNNNDYLHNIPPSFESKLIQFILGMTGMKRSMERKMLNNTFKKDPASIPKSLYRNFNIQEIALGGRKVWRLSPPKGVPDLVVLFLHGGAYMANISLEHWNLVGQLMEKTGATFVVPDYPLAPEATCGETYGFMEELYAQLISEDQQTRLVLMGDSAGGGLALGLVQKLRNKKLRLPHQLVLFSPWLDISMEHPDLKYYEKRDKILSVEGLKNAGQKYAGNLDLKSYEVSPIYGDFSGMCGISIFTGTNDLLHTDARRCKELLSRQRLIFNYFEYLGMFHDWVIITSLRESKDVITKVCDLVNDVVQNE